MSERLMLIRFEPGHSIRAVEEGKDPYLGGTDFTDHGDGFYSAQLGTGVYDIYWKDDPQSGVWVKLEHYQGRFHPTDDLTEKIDKLTEDVSELSLQVKGIIGEPARKPRVLWSKKTPVAIHIRLEQQAPDTLYIVRGAYHHPDERVTIDETSRVLYAGYSTECILPNALRFADTESRPYGDVVLTAKIWAKNNAGISEPTEAFTIPLDLDWEREIFCNSATRDCSKKYQPDKFIVGVRYPGAFPKTPIGENKEPLGPVARTVSLPFDSKLIRIEAESITPARNECFIYFRDKFSENVYRLRFKKDERLCRSESTPDSNPQISVLRFPESEVQVYSPDADSLTDVEIRMIFEA